MNKPRGTLAMAAAKIRTDQNRFIPNKNCCFYISELVSQHKISYIDPILTDQNIISICGNMKKTKLGCFRGSINHLNCLGIHRFRNVLQGQLLQPGSRLLLSCMGEETPDQSTQGRCPTYTPWILTQTRSTGLRHSLVLIILNA